LPILNWIGKQDVIDHERKIPFRLLENGARKLTSSENLLLEGDNLEALKALLPYYQNKIKCVYIDPPYNTGNEDWVYNDNVDSPKMRKWLGEHVKEDDLTRHDKWLCMMYPRLKLLKELMRSDGIIFVSIDDNESSNLRAIMDEIFDKQNFVAQLPTIMNLKGNNDEFGFAGTHEYVLVYAKNKETATIGEFKIDDEEIDEWEEDEWGFFKKGANLKSTGINAPREKRPNLFFPLYVSKKNTVSTERKSKNDVEIFPITDGKEMSWRWQKSKIQNEPHNIIVVQNKNSVSIYKKQRPSLGDLPSKKPKSLFYKPEYSSGNGTELLKRIFGTKVFQNPKPLELIKDLISIICDKDDIVLDSFAGSGTTGHAVLKLNEEDDGNRKFILIEMDSKICKSITSQRLKKVISGYSYNSTKIPGLKGNFENLKLGKPLFDSDGKIEKSTSFVDLASYIFFTETKTLLDEKLIIKNFIGSKNDIDYFLLFSTASESVLNKKTLSEFDKTRSKVIYADKCLISNDVLEKYNIVFKQIPYEVRLF